MMKQSFITIVSLILLMFAGAGYGRVKHDRPWRVGKVVLVGNTTFRRFELLNEMDLRTVFLKKNPRFNASRLKSDLRSLNDFYTERGFLMMKTGPVTVVRDSIRKKVFISITIDEGPRTMISEMSIHGGRIDSSVVNSIKCKPGVPLIQSFIRQDIQGLREARTRKGYLKADVSANQTVDSIAHAATIDFFVNDGPLIVVDTILINGNEQLAPRIISRELLFHPGDTLTSVVLRKSEQRLYQTNLLRSVSIEPIVTDSSSQLLTDIYDTTPQPFPVAVNFHEADFFKLKLGAGYGQNDGPRGLIETSYNNLFRSGHRLTWKGNVSLKIQQTMFVYTTPWFLGVPLRFDASLYYNRFSNRDTYRGGFRGILLSLERTTDFNITLQGWIKFEDVVWISSENLPREYPDKNTQSFGFDLTYDTRNDLLNPSTGIYNLCKAALAGITGMNSNQFTKLTNDTRFYWQSGRLRFASGLKLGWVRPYGKSAAVPLQDRFFAGGSRSVRGFKDNFLLTTMDSTMHAQSGTILATANLLEMRFPLFWWINGALFADAGILRNSGDSKSPDSIINEIRWTAGPGLRVDTPLAILRFDFGFKLNRRAGESLTQWHLDVGQSF